MYSIGDLRRAEGIGAVIAWIGFLIMLGGLLVFGFGLLSTIGSVSSGGEVPRGFPPYALYGFGAAIVGAIAFWIGLEIGLPKDSGGGDIIIDQVGHRFGDIIDSDVDIDAPINLTIDQRRIQYVNTIESAVYGLGLTGGRRQEAESAVDEVRAAVRQGQSERIADRLGRLTKILAAAGAFAVSGNTAAAAIIALANTLGPAGKAVLQLFRH